ncbi:MULTISPECIES: hypothetical protein [unclassified Micromonospora]|uniref:hypothetical protein n=1 Tax=unclassified Micromonospora TaxID=2617518 RepID=UPI00103481A6|nr:MULTISPECIES: hypothetical protein [unclassified Micromonospora]QKW15924.1 hypothetical protein HUT12_26365 [Verrucosispora sp. NA02020]TBL42201.1 hypothetical protein EYA84_04490 [Verrucosispora sp. SN26_14.1]
MKRLWTPAWIARHVALVVLVTTFLSLGWWQVSRAAAGNAISWGYAVEWPIFAGFVVFVWWREVRHTLREQPTAESGDSTGAPDTSTAPDTSAGGDQAGVIAGTPEADRPRSGFRRPVRVARATAVEEVSDDADLAAYNRYLSWLNANPGAKPGDYPG